MLDILGMVRALKRPGLLIRAARFGLDDYRRDRMLPRLLKTENTPRPGEALILLMDIEAMLNDQRQTNAAAYRPAIHISVLTALMGEARVLNAVTRPASDGHQRSSHEAIGH